MLSWSTIVAFLKALAAVIGLGRQIVERIDDERERSAGRAEAERDQAQEGTKVEGEIADETAKDITEQEAIDILKGGRA